MPEITATHVGLLAVSAAIGAIVGWILRSNRAVQEKAAINAGWQEQIESHGSEHDRLLDQNKGLMSQISHLQASNQDARKRSREMSAAVKEASARRDELQRQIKDIRSNLEVALTQRDKLQTDIAAKSDTADGDRQKDLKIFQLSRELESWQQRLPPLVERYRKRNEEALQLEAELDALRQRFADLQNGATAEAAETDSVGDNDTLAGGGSARNDPDDGAAAAPLQSTDGSADDGARTLRDNLQEIKGVGPAIEQTLNEMGIFRYQQIADMTEYDIDRIARRLQGLHSRIYRENWIGQARELNDRSNAV